MLNQPNNNPFGGTFDKIDAITDAYSQLRISGLTVDPTPEDLEVALDRLECMAAEWAERNICSNYNFEDDPDPNSITGVKRAYKQAYATNLAVRLIPDFNKTVPPQLQAQANQSLSNLSARSAAARLQQTAYPTRMARGSGNTLRYNRWQRFYRGEAESQSCKAISIFIDDINDYVEHYDAYLREDEVISAIEITTDSGIDLLSSSFTDNDVSYQVQGAGVNGVSSNVNRKLTIIITTDLGRVQTRIVYFNVSARPGQEG